jgi:DNA-binding PadR family transcriptional regulator
MLGFHPLPCQKDESKQIDRVIKSLQKLLKLGLIRHAGTKKIKTRPRNVYEIVDIWEMNLNYYSNHQNNTSETIENQEEVIHNHNSGDLSTVWTNPRKKFVHSMDKLKQQNRKNQLKINKLNEKSENLRKTILKKKNKIHHHPEKTMTMLITQSNPNPLKKKSSQRERAYSLISTFNPLIDKFGIDRVLFVMDLINYRYKYKLVSHPFKLLLKILKDRYLIHNEFYKYIRGKKKGDSVPVLITCKSCNHKGIAELKVGGKYSLPCSKCGTFAEIDLIIKL